MIIGALFFPVVQCASAIEGLKPVENLLSDNMIAIENSLSLTNEAKLKLVALEMLDRQTDTDYYVGNSARGWLPIPTQFEKHPVLRWVAVSGRSYDLKNYKK